MNYEPLDTMYRAGFRLTRPFEAPPGRWRRVGLDVVACRCGRYVADYIRDMLGQDFVWERCPG